MQKPYACKYCGKQWNTNQSRNGHQSWCPLNPLIQNRKQKLSSKMKGTVYGPRPSKNEYKIQCAKCGKQYTLELTEFKFNSGEYKKYCSRSCANSRTWTEQDKLKKSISAKHSELVKLASLSNKKQKVRKICPVCTEQYFVAPSDNKRIYCSAKCRNNDSPIKYRRIGKRMYQPGGGHGKCGWYSGIYCASSWQLAYVIYCLQHNINISRCTQKRTYYIEGQVHQYNPDFVVENKIIQIKGWENDTWKYKQEQHPDVVVLRENDLKPMFQYVINKYGKDYIKLYER